MVNLGNEQHEMSIRQPMTTKSLFLYMEDGIPIRPLGVFNHNAMNEINIAGIDSVEVVKGAASSLYGSNAVGGAVNFLTAAPSRTKLSAQAPPMLPLPPVMKAVWPASAPSAGLFNGGSQPSWPQQHQCRVRAYSAASSRQCRSAAAAL